jgi:hypothetical protein
VILIEVVPHPKIRGDWLVRSAGLLPYPVWYKDKQHAISYAEWLARNNKAQVVVRDEPQGKLAGNEQKRV